MRKGKASLAPVAVVLQPRLVRHPDQDLCGVRERASVRMRKT